MFIYLVYFILHTRGQKCFSDLSRAWMSACCYPINSECFDLTDTPEVCCEFALLNKRKCFQGCDPNRLSLSFEPFVRTQNHQRTLIIYEDLLDRLSGSYDTGHDCLFEKIVSLTYGYLKSDLETGTRKISAVSKLFEFLLECDMTDDEMWRAAHLTRPLLWYLVNLKQLWGSETFNKHRSVEMFADLKSIPFTLNRVASHSVAWDLGASDGLDTFYYKQFAFERLVAVEPNPPAVRLLARRLRTYLSEQTVVIVEKAIVAFKDQVEFQLPFDSNEAHSQSSKLTNVSDHNMLVSVTNCASLADVFSAPFLLKIDIEDHSNTQPCLEDLCVRGLQPMYVSVETSSISHLQQLIRCGYTKFKLVRQSLYSVYSRQGDKIHRKFTQSINGELTDLYLHSASGPFGEDAIDWIEGPSWRSAAEIADDMALINFARDNPGEILYRLFFLSHSNGVDWFDLHAKFG